MSVDVLTPIEMFSKCWLSLENIKQTCQTNWNTAKIILIK